MAGKKFKCDQWQVGQECKRYYTSPWYLRAFLTFLGVCVALGIPALNLWDTLATAPSALQRTIVGWTIGYGVAALAGFIFAFVHEKEWAWCFLTAIGIPALVVAAGQIPPHLISLPH